MHAMTASLKAIQFHGLEALRLTAAGGASAVVSLRGAQVLSWLTADGEEQLYLSGRAHFDGSFPIRGGIPVCFPQFSDLGPLPKHGLVRTRRWQLAERSCADGCARVELELRDDDHSRALWPHRFRAGLTVAVEDDRLDVELSIRNTGEASFCFTGALHSYLRVRDLPAASLQGLTGLVYRDATGGGDVWQTDTAPQLEVTERLSRIYREASGPLLLIDGSRRLAIRNEGFPDAVLWNPWAALCATLPDMAPEDFGHMLCVEAAIDRTPVALAAEESWTGRQTLMLRLCS